MGRGRREKKARQRSKKQKLFKAAGHRGTLAEDFLLSQLPVKISTAEAIGIAVLQLWGEMGIKWNCNHTWKEPLTKFLTKRTELLWQKTDVKEHIYQACFYIVLLNSRKDDSGGMELQSIICNRMMREKYSTSVYGFQGDGTWHSPEYFLLLHVLFHWTALAFFFLLN